jgi:hypothetical protein
VHERRNYAYRKEELLHFFKETVLDVCEQPHNCIEAREYNADWAHADSNDSHHVKPSKLSIFDSENTTILLFSLITARLKP